MSKCFVALNEKGEVFAATWKPDGDLRHYEAEWFPGKVIEVDDPRSLPWMEQCDADPDGFDDEKTAAIRALLDERDALKARVAELEGEVAKTYGPLWGYMRLTVEAPEDVADTDLPGWLRGCIDESRRRFVRVAELEGELAALQPRPISTAPKDGMRVLLSFPSNISDLEAQPGDTLHFPPHVILCRWLALGNNEGWYDGHSFRNCNWLGWSLLPPAMKTVPLSPAARAAILDQSKQEEGK